MNAFLRGFTKVFSGNFYASPRISKNSLSFDPAEILNDFPEVKTLFLHRTAWQTPMVKIELIEDKAPKRKQKRHSYREQ